MSNLSGQFKPVSIPKGKSARTRAVNQMTDRIVKTYLAGSSKEYHQGETFYSQDAHGAARSLASGWDPNGGAGKLLRTTPSPGERQTEWQHGETSELPVTPQRKEYEGKVRQAAGVLARLSPQTSWEDNVAQAHEVYTKLNDEHIANLVTNKRNTAGKVDKKTGEHPRWPVTQDTSLGGKRMVLNNQPTDTILHAHEIATGAKTPEENIHGAGEADEGHRVKVGSFFRNIADPDAAKPPVTVDFRAHDIATGRLLNTSVNRGMSAKGRYSMFEEAHNAAAARLNQDYPELRTQKQPLNGMKVQAATWWIDKNHQDTAMGKTGGNLPRARRGNKAVDRNMLRTPAGQEE